MNNYLWGAPQSHSLRSKMRTVAGISGILLQNSSCPTGCVISIDKFIGMVLFLVPFVHSNFAHLPAQKEEI